MPEVKYEITGDAGKLQNAAREAETALKAMDRAADGAGKSIDRASGKAGGAEKSLNGLKKVAMGSGFGQIAGDIEDLGEGMMALGPAGGAAAAGLLAVGAAAYVITSLSAEVWEAAASVEALDAKFEGLSVPGFVRATNEATEASQNLKAATEGVGLVLDQAYLEVGNRAAPVLDDLAGYVVAGGLAAKDAYVHYLGLRDSFIDLVGPAADFAKELMPITHLLRAGAEAGGEYTAQAIVLTTQIRAKAAADKNAEGIAKAAAEADRLAEEAERKREAAIRKSAAALRDKQKAQEEATKASIEADLLLASIGEELGAEMDADDARRAKERLDLAKMISAAKEAQMAIDVRNMDELAATEADALAKRKANAQATYAFLAGAAQDFLATQIAAAEDGTEAQKKAGKAAFLAQKTLTTAQIVVDGIRAVSVAMASAPPPANFALAGVVGAAYLGLATQAAAAPPPKFHTGGEVDATLLDGEHVMDRRASRNNREALNEMNRTGELPSGGDSRAFVVIGDRMADDITTRGIRGPKSTAALRTSGRTGRTRTYR